MTRGFIRTQPVVAQDGVYVWTGDSRVVAVRLPPPSDDVSRAPFAPGGFIVLGSWPPEFWMFSSLCASVGTREVSKGRRCLFR